MILKPKPYLRELSLRRDQIVQEDRYPFNIPAVRKLRTIRFHPDVTFIVGENGSGKSTLLEAIAIAWGVNPEGRHSQFPFLYTSFRVRSLEMHSRGEICSEADEWIFLAS
jgi:predicted ATPase